MKYRQAKKLKSKGPEAFKALDAHWLRGVRRNAREYCKANGINIHSRMAIVRYGRRRATVNLWLPGEIHDIVMRAAFQ